MELEEERDMLMQEKMDCELTPQGQERLRQVLDEIKRGEGPGAPKLENEEQSKSALFD